MRLEEWLEAGFCYELSAISMMLLKNYQTARLCHGDFRDKNGNLKTKHSWVEVMIPSGDWFVIDFAWMPQWICKRGDYYRRCHSYGALTCKWVCTYDDFWKIQFPNILYEAMKNSKTSSVLLELSGFCDPKDGYGFQKWIYEAKELRFSDGSYMIPCYKFHKNKPISGIIIRDFVKNPKRRSPKAKSLRRTKMVILRLTKKVQHKFEIWKSQQITA